MRQGRAPDDGESMSVPWYAFNFKDYSSDTARLSCEAHGAYVQLIADYYNTGAPMPDDDEQISDLVKLPLERWKVLRPRLERFFRIEGGFWHHDRVEKAMRDAEAKHAAGTARAKHAARVRHGKTDTSATTNKQEAPHEEANGIDLSSEHAPSSSDVSPEAGDLYLYNTTLSTKAIDSEEEVHTPISRSFQPSEGALMACRADGATDADIEHDVGRFILTHEEKGSFSANWDATYRKWWMNWKPHRDKELAKAATRQRAPPRVELNTVPFEPNEEQWARTCDLFVKGIRWPKAGYGPDPDSPACRCPREILLKHGLRKETVAP
jgi:uncharacterized protein YdaU (DUF1376 family)